MKEELLVVELGVLFGLSFVDDVVKGLLIVVMVVVGLVKMVLSLCEVL